MQIDFSKLRRDSMGRLEAPVPVLMKPHGEVISPVGHYFGMNGELKFNETSQITFSYPRYQTDGAPTPLFDELVGDRLLQIDPYGIFIIGDVTKTAEGRKEVKEVVAYSREYELASKPVIFAEGTYNFWNPADPENTILGMVVAQVRNWKVGSVSASLVGKYRAFDSDVDVKALDFLYGTVQETFGCVIVFDTYHRAINAIDVSSETTMVPVYLSADNLIKDQKITETRDQMFTRLYVRGADDVSIYNVNPAGDSYLYNLDYYIGMGELPSALAQKWREWQLKLMTNQAYYTSLVALRNSTNSRYIVEQAKLTDLRNERSSLENVRATLLQQQQNSEAGSSSYEYCTNRLAEIATEHAAVEAKITAQETLLTTIKSEYDAHAKSIAGLVATLSMNSYFSAAELDLLEPYFKTDTFADETFAVFDVSIESDDSFASASSATLSLSDIRLEELQCDGHIMSAISGGKVTLAGGDHSVTANLIHGTLDHKDGALVCSLFLGSGTVNGDEFPSGNLTCVAKATYSDSAVLSGMTRHEDTKTQNGASHTVIYYTGATSISVTEAKLYFTRNVTDYQRYSVEQDLYDYASECMKEISVPTYEFEIGSGNILWAEKFEPFRNAIQLGCGVYLQISDDLMVKPVLLEIHLDFESPDNFSLVFSNRFRKPDNVNQLSKNIEDAVGAAKTLDLNKYAFGDSKNTKLWVQNLIQNGYDAAMAQINAGGNTVSIDQAGIKVESADGVDTIHLSNGMIALVDRRTNIVKMAMGHFLNPASGQDYIGVLADVIAGILVAGQNLIIECPDPNGGVMQFKVDSSGVILNNGRMYMRTERGAMGWDANHGFFAGTKDLFTTTDTGYVSPVCIDSNGNLILDDDGFPEDVNVWIGIDGKVYVRGKIYAEDGVFNGTVYAKGGEFKGVVQASDFRDSSGKSMMTSDGKFDADYLSLMGIDVVNSAGQTVLTIGEDGIRFPATYSPIKYQYSSDGINWHNTMTTADKYRRESYNGGTTYGVSYQFKGTDGRNGADGSDASVTYYNIRQALMNAANVQTSFITADELGAPNIYGGHIYGAEIFAGTGSSTFAKINEDGFYLHHADNNTPKATLTASSDGNLVQMILGAGTSSGDNPGRFFLSKTTDRASVLYYSGNLSGTGYAGAIGFTFHDDGTIDVHGNLNATTVAVFQ